MYGKIFKSIYDGTLADDWRALITFQQMIILCDADGILDMTPLALQKRTGIPIEHIKAGIEILEAVDIYSRSKENEGRRIERIDPDRPWGWVIINHTLYKNLRTASDRREYMRNYMKDIRKTKKLTEVNRSLQELTKANCKQPLTVLANKDTDTDKDKNTDTDINKDKENQPPLSDKPDMSDQTIVIFEFWKKTLNHPRSKLDDKRKKLIKRSLKLGYTVDDLMSAIVGCSKTPHNMGVNDNGQKYDSIDLIFRDADHLDRFIRNDANPPIVNNKVLNSNIEAGKSFLGK